MSESFNDKSFVESIFLLFSSSLASLFFRNRVNFQGLKLENSYYTSDQAFYIKAGEQYTVSAFRDVVMSANVIALHLDQTNLKS